MNTVDLFSGIGGIALGLEAAGFKTAAFCERDEFCRQVLRKHWPDVPQHTDIRKMTGEEFEQGSIGLVSGGYPCQPFSTAGRRRGTQDERHLWPEMHRIIKVIRPTWVLGENVAGHVNMGLDEVLTDLAHEGYEAQAFVIPALAVDAPHRRDRVWVVAHSKSIAGGGRFCQTDKRERWDLSRDGGCPVSDADRSQCEGGGLSSGVHAEHADFGDARRWPAEPGVGRVAYGVSRRMDRLRALGNSVVPQVVEVIGRAIMRAHYNQQEK